jgi:hypothetical protein
LQIRKDVRMNDGRKTELKTDGREGKQRSESY